MVCCGNTLAPIWSQSIGEQPICSLRLAVAPEKGRGFSAISAGFSSELEGLRQCGTSLGSLRVGRGYVKFEYSLSKITSPMPNSDKIYT